jgi:quercetin dioxygenase-like cupin family protein
MAKKKKKESFGARLKGLREGKGLSVGELAALVHLKPRYLEKLEADEVLPPVAEIIRLARTLSVEPTDFMEGGPKASPGKRKKALATRTSEYAYETLTPDEHDKHLMAFRVTIDPKSEHHRVGYQHEGEEFVYVLSGRLRIKVGRKVSELKAGESIHFDSGKRHRLSNPGRKPTVLMVVIYTP